MITISFPFSINPEVVVGNAMYSKEAYESILEQFQKGVPVFNDVEGKGDVLGITNSYEGGRVFINIDSSNFANYLIIRETDLCMSSFIEADVIVKDGLQIAKSAKVHYLVILSKSNVPGLLEKMKEDNAVVTKEVTLDLIPAPKEPEIVACVEGCRGEKDLCIPLIVKACEEGKRVFVVYGGHIKSKIERIGEFKFETVYQNGIPVGLWIEKGENREEFHWVDKNSKYSFKKN